MNQELAGSNVNGNAISGWDCPLVPGVLIGWFGSAREDVLTMYAADDAKVPSSCVYFIRRASDGAIKVGYAASVKDRMKALKREQGCELVLLATAPGARCLESVYHAAFKEHHLHGEWFHPEPPILGEVNRLNGSEAA